MPRVDLPEILLEAHARTGFLDAFTHESEAGARAAGLATGTAARLGVRGRKRYFRACIPAEVEATWPGS